jgi:hypothetical protein
MYVCQHYVAHSQLGARDETASRKYALLPFYQQQRRCYINYAIMLTHASMMVAVLV